MVLSILIMPLQSYSHDGKTHRAEMRSVLGLQYNPELDEWLRFISEDMIDSWTPFYNKLRAQNGFKNLSIQNHRALFHWTLSGEPWNQELEDAVRKAYPGKADSKYRSFYTRILKLELLKEQKRRKDKIEDKCKKLFSLNDGGVEKYYLRSLCTIVYDCHLIGDYMSDNSQFKGLAKLQEIIAEIISAAKELDLQESKTLANALEEIKDPDRNPQINSDKLMLILQDEYPKFLKFARKGQLKRRLEKRGFKFIG